MSVSPEPPEDEVVYREVLYLTFWIYVALLPLLIFFAVLIVPAAAKGFTGTAVFSGVVTVFLILVLVNFLRLEFVITEKTVSFGFGVFKKRFPREAVTGCEPYRLTLSNYLGYGIRWGRDGTTAYNTRNGPGVKLLIDGQTRPYVVSLNDPTRVCGILSGGAREPGSRGRA